MEKMSKGKRVAREEKLRDQKVEDLVSKRRRRHWKLFLSIGNRN